MTRALWHCYLENLKKQESNTKMATKTDKPAIPVKIFNRWPIEGIAIEDEGLSRYVTLDGRFAPKKISQEVSGQVQITSARDALLQKLSLMGERSDAYEERKQLEAVDGEIIEKLPQEDEKMLVDNTTPKFPPEFAAEFKVPKPTKLLNALDEDRDAG